MYELHAINGHLYVEVYSHSKYDTICSDNI